MVEALLVNVLSFALYSGKVVSTAVGKIIHKQCLLLLLTVSERIPFWDDVTIHPRNPYPSGRQIRRAKEESELETAQQEAIGCRVMEIPHQKMIVKEQCMMISQW